MTPDMAVAWVSALNELEDLHPRNTANLGNYSYEYVDLAHVTATARTVLGRHGLAVSQSVTSRDGQVCVTTIVVHASGDLIEFGPTCLAAGKGAQDTGSAITYARRYGLMAALGITAAGSDDDGRRAQDAATAPHPLSGRVSAVMTDLRGLPKDAQEEIRAWANGRSLAPAAMLGDEKWLALVETWLDERAQS